MTDRFEEIKDHRKYKWSGDTGESEWWFADVRDALDWLIAEIENLKNKGGQDDL